MKSQMLAGDHVAHGSSIGEFHLSHPSHGHATSTIIPEISVRPSSIGSGLESTQHHYGIECVCAGHETPDYSHEGQGDHSFSQQGSH